MDRARLKRFATISSLTAALCAGSWLPSIAHAGDTTKRTCDGVSLPDREQAFGTELRLNGMGIRSVTFLGIHVYVAGLYLERPSKSAAEVLKRGNAKVMTMVFVRDATREQMVSTIREVIADQEPEIRAAARKSFPDLEKRLPEPRKGGRLTLAYRPGHGLELRYDGKVTGTWKDDALAELLFHIWLGKKPADDGLKAGLLGGECD